MRPLTILDFNGIFQTKFINVDIMLSLAPQADYTYRICASILSKHLEV